MEQSEIKPQKKFKWSEIISLYFSFTIRITILPMLFSSRLYALCYFQDSPSVKPETLLWWIWTARMKRLLCWFFLFFMLLLLGDFFLENLLIPWEPILASRNSFNVDFINQKLPPRSTTNPVGDNYMSKSQKQRRSKQSYFHGSICSRPNTKHIRSFPGNKHQWQNRTRRRNRQVRPSRQSWPIAKAIHTNDDDRSENGDDGYVDEGVAEVVVCDMGREGL